jgi:transcriptional regulator NrdR family protein
MTKVLETRRNEDGLIRRRRQLPNGRTYWTIELPETVFNGVAVHFDKRLAAWKRAEKQRDLHLAVDFMLGKGYKRAYIAAVVGTTEAVVRKRDLKKTKEQ